MIMIPYVTNIKKNVVQFQGTRLHKHWYHMYWGMDVSGEAVIVVHVLQAKFAYTCSKYITFMGIF